MPKSLNTANKLNDSGISKNSRPDSGRPTNLIYLYYTEDPSIGGALSSSNCISMLDQFIYMVGSGERACIHPINAEYSATSQNVFNTLEEAHEKYKKYNWVYLDPKAKESLSTFLHPKGDTVYVVGHDSEGYGKSKLIGKQIKIMNFEGHALPCLISALVDRWSKSWQ